MTVAQAVRNLEAAGGRIITIRGMLRHIGPEAEIRDVAVAATMGRGARYDHLGIGPNKMGSYTLDTRRKR